MRKVLLFLAIALLGQYAKAQSQTEYHIGIGTGSVQELAVRNATHPLFNVASLRTETPTYAYSVAGPVRIGVKKHEGKHFLLGADFNYSNIEMMSTYADGSSHFSNFVNYTLMASTQYKFIDKPKLTLYSGIDFGVSFASVKNQENGRTNQDLTAAFQVNFLGARYGSKYGLFAELGYGFNGFANGGLFCRLD